MNAFVYGQLKPHQPTLINQKSSHGMQKPYSTLDLSLITHGICQPMTSKGQDRKLPISNYSQRLQKENRPVLNLPEQKPIISKSSSSTAVNFCQDELITRIKKYNQIRQKSQQNMQPFGYNNSQKKLITEQVNHQRYRSTIQQKQQNPITFKQLLSKNSNMESTRRDYNNPILERYGYNQEVIHEEQTPFVEVKVFKPIRPSQQFQNFLSEAMRLSRPKNCNKNNTSQTHSRSRIKESMFQQTDQSSISSQRNTCKPTDYLSKISCIASQPFYNRSFEPLQNAYLSNTSSNTTNRDMRSRTNGLTVIEVKNSIENMCRLSQQQMHLLHQTRREIDVPEQTLQTAYNHQTYNQQTAHNNQTVQTAHNNQTAQTAQNHQRQMSIKNNTPIAEVELEALDSPYSIESPELEGANMQFDLTCSEEVKIPNEEDTRAVEAIKSQEDEEVVKGYCQQTLKHLVDRDRDYQVDAHYLNNKQPNITWMMRSILIDWMMEVSCEFHLKRETFYLAVYYVDIYLSKADPISKSLLQLVGLTSMLVATKIEEIYPRKVSDFAKAADFGYTVEEILKQEIRLLTVHKWLINPPTLNLWLNWYMGEWDTFIEQQGYKWEQVVNGRLCQFKKPTEESYQLYCDLTQLVDSCVIEIQSLQYHPRTIIASFMYLVLVKAYNIFASNEIQNIKYGSLFLLDQQNLFNNLFRAFVGSSFGFSLFELLPAIQYASTFFPLEIVYQAPPGVQTLQNTPLESHYEEFLSFQLHSKFYLAFVKERCRDEI